MILMSRVNDELSADFFLFSAYISIPVKMDRKCKNNPERFCYIYGNVVLPNRQTKVTDFIK